VPGQYYVLICPFLKITVKPVNIFLDACAQASLRMTGQVKGIRIDKMLLLEIPDGTHSTRPMNENKLHLLIPTGFAGVPILPGSTFAVINTRLRCKG
jgi:hypothetical protein